MPFVLIKGSFHVVNYSPDGDSIRFRPEDAGLLDRLTGFKPRLNARGHVQLRIEAIDTLETHYTPPSGGGVYHQPLELARGAAARLLDFAGVTDAVWDTSRNIVTAANEATPGYILARAVEKNGRVIAFVYAGDAPEADGAEVRLDVERLRDSYNHAAVAEGWAYPTYYKGLFADLREELTRVCAEAQTAERGVWLADRTVAGFAATDLSVVTSQTPILPKLFRRLVEYMVNFGTAEGFKEKMAQSREPVLDLRTQNFTHLDTFIEQAEGSVDIRLSRRPEELVFDEMPQRPPSHFSALMSGAGVAPPRFVRTISAPVEAFMDISSY